ncbi:MAG: EAL domain-containing protein [Gallionella sp.]|jgi:diguanylate cyclase (GGDEF)-like protein/PAS domain S-box-containing protein|nr:EAL domain-containing protein [Gallionella sp.]MCK9354500.1 EAL domain-containing protein [Gallionella sp.]
MKKVLLSEILTASVTTVPPNAVIVDVMAAMASRGISCVVAVDGERKPLGIFTERDAVRLLAERRGLDSLKMADVMSTPPFTSSADIDFREAYRLLQGRGFRHLVVVNGNGQLEGIVTEGDFLHHLDAGDLSEFKSAEKVMSRNIITVDVGDTVADAIGLMSRNRYSCVVVTRAQIPYGILTERDVVRLAPKLAAGDITIGDVVRTPLITMPPNTALPDAIKYMDQHKIRHLVIVEDDKLLGLVTRHDMVKTLQGSYVNFLHETILGQRRELFKLVQQHSLFKLHDSALAAAANAIVIADRQAVVQWANPAFSKLTGYSLEETVGNHIRELVRSGEQSTEFYETLWNTILAGRVWRGEIVNKRKDGALYPEEMTITPVCLEGDAITHFIAVKQNISERKRTEEQLRESAAVMRNTHEGVVITDTVPNIIAINEAYTTITGYSAGESIGKNPGMLGSGRADKAFYQAMWEEIVERGYWQGEVWNRRKNGEIYPQLLTISTVYNDKQQPIRYIGVFSDITQIKENQAQLEFMAHHDPLTKLPNRALVESRLQQELEQGHRHHLRSGVLFIDLDHFKPVNDSFGHLVGDELLCAVAERLSQRLREGDTLGRLGGDEFILLLSMLHDTQDAAVVARDLIAALNEPFQLADGQEVFIGGSIGISLFPQDGETVSELMKNADAAMYLAKESGRNQFSFYTKELNADARNKLALENELRRALLQNELTLHYQPKADLRSGRIVGAEALSRWQLADGNWISPAQFIPIAEKSGLILDLGNWVIEQSCEQIRAWMDDGLQDICIAINISARQFRSGNLDAQLSEALERHGIAAHHLEIELTESMLMQEPDRAIETMHKLKQLGVKISLDDFGTGYSSLGYLSRFPIDTLKIDQSFVRGVTTVPDDAEIASAIIGLAHRMKLRVVAEGVETADQLAFLRGNDCDELQGYYFSKPIPADDFAALVRSGKMLAD